MDAILSVGGEIECAECGVRQRCVMSLEAHLSAVHLRYIPYECADCEFIRLPSEYMLLQHSVNVHKRQLIRTRNSIQQGKLLLLDDMLNKSLLKWRGQCTDDRRMQAVKYDSPKKEEVILPSAYHIDREAVAAKNADTSNDAKIEQTNDISSPPNLQRSAMPEPETEIGEIASSLLDDPTPLGETSSLDSILGTPTANCTDNSQCSKQFQISLLRDSINSSTDSNTERTNEGDEDDVEDATTFELSVLDDVDSAFAESISDESDVDQTDKTRCKGGKQMALPKAVMEARRVATKERGPPNTEEWLLRFAWVLFRRTHPADIVIGMRDTLKWNHKYKLSLEEFGQLNPKSLFLCVMISIAEYTRHTDIGRCQNEVILVELASSIVLFIHTNIQRMHNDRKRLRNSVVEGAKKVKRRRRMTTGAVKKRTQLSSVIVCATRRRRPIRRG